MKKEDIIKSISEAHPYLTGLEELTVDNLKALHSDLGAEELRQSLTRAKEDLAIANTVVEELEGVVELHKKKLEDSEKELLELNKALQDAEKSGDIVTSKHPVFKAKGKQFQVLGSTKYNKEKYSAQQIADNKDGVRDELVKIKSGLIVELETE